jgi:glycine cleavage system H protein
MISETATNLQLQKEFQKGRVWVEAREGAYALGLTHLGTEALGDLDLISLPPEGALVSEGDVLVELEGSEGQLEILAPFALEVQAVNESAEKNLERVSEDPLEEGWLVKFQIVKSTKAHEA